MNNQFCPRYLPIRCVDTLQPIKRSSHTAPSPDKPKIYIVRASRNEASKYSFHRCAPHQLCCLTDVLSPTPSLNAPNTCSGIQRMLNRCLPDRTPLNIAFPIKIDPQKWCPRRQNPLSFARYYQPFFLAKRLFSSANTFGTLNCTYSRSSASWLSFCISRRSSSFRSNSSSPRLRPTMHTC